nr:hypothetical protein [Tanacetum cinerariifolium]
MFGNQFICSFEPEANLDKEMVRGSYHRHDSIFLLNCYGVRWQVEVKQTYANAMSVVEPVWPDFTLPLVFVPKVYSTSQSDTVDLFINDIKCKVFIGKIPSVNRQKNFKLSFYGPDWWSMMDELAIRPGRYFALTLACKGKFSLTVFNNAEEALKACENYASYVLRNSNFHIGQEPGRMFGSEFTTIVEPSAKLVNEMIPLLYRGEYSQWYERFMNYLKEQTDGEAMINSIQNGDQPLPVIAQVSLAGNAQNAPPTLKDLKFWTAEEKKTRKIDHNCELNYKFLNNLQPEWKQYGTLIRQTKNQDINIDALNNILQKNQGDVNDALGYKKKAVVVTSDPLVLVAEKTNVSKRKKKVVVSLDSKGSDTDDFSELKKITALLAKAFNRRKF